MEKKTKIDMYLQIRAHLTDSEEIEFIDKQIALTEKKNASRSNKPTKAATENAKYAEIVLAYMKNGKRYTVTEIQNGVAELKEFSNQRVTAIIRSLLKVGAIERTEEKGKAYFSKI